MSIDVHIWSDIACPWCFIGKRRFEKALAQFADEQFAHDIDVQVTWRSYQLDPTLPEHDDRSEADYLVAAKGMPRDTVQQMLQHVTSEAKGEGLEYDFDRLVVANSRRAHRLLQGAKLEQVADGGQRANALKEALLSAHFEQGLDLSDADVLVAIAAEVGFGQSEARDALDSAELDAAVERDIAEGAAIGVRGVPFFVFDNKYGVSGAQPPEVFLEVLRTTAAEQTSGLITVNGDTGDSCGPEGC